MASSRPRRSAAASTVSYKHLLRPKLGLDSSSSDEAAAGGGGPQLAPEDIDDESDESDWEAERRAEADKAAKRAAQDGLPVLPLSSSSDDDDDDLSAEEEVEDDQESGANDDELEGSIAGSSESDGMGGRRRKTGPGYSTDDEGGPKLKHQQRGKGHKIRLVGTKVADGAKAKKDAEAEGRYEPPRAYARPTAVAVTFQAVAPQFEPPVRRLDLQASHSDGNGNAAHVTYSARSMEDGERTEMLETLSLLPFGPEPRLLHDVGWWKGKWELGEEPAGGAVESQTKMRMRRRWGGWYDDLPLGSVNGDELLEVDVTESYHPRIVFPSVPSRIDVEVEPANPKAAAAATADDMAIDGDVDGGTPQPTQTQTPVQTQTQSLTSAQKLKIWIGSLKGDSASDEASGNEAEADNMGDNRERRTNQRLIEIGRFESHRLDEFLPRKPGYLFHAGGPVSGLDWCPLVESPNVQRDYLAISTLSSPLASISHATAPGPTLIQIWSLDTTHAKTDLSMSTASNATDRGEAMGLVMGLCIDELGDALEIKWCPKGGEDEGQSGEQMDVDQDGQTGESVGPAAREGRLGLLAGAFSDGSVAVFDVPAPQDDSAATVYLRVKPILRLTLPDTTCCSVAWSSHERIAAGCDNGHVAVWNVGDALRKGLPTVRPILYFPTNFASIRSLTFVRQPPLSRTLDGTLNATTGEPPYIVTAGHDGSVILVDLSESTSPMTMYHDRGVVNSVAYVPHLGTFMAADADACVRAVMIKAKEFGSSRVMMKCAGAVRSLAASDHHPFVAAAAADGTCTVSNAVRGNRRKAHKGHYTQKVFRLDFNRKTGEYRMLDNFHIDQVSGIDILMKQSKGGKGATAVSSKEAKQHAEAALSGAWPAEMVASRVCWHPSLRRACALATGTAAGLVRVDWVEGGEDAK